MAGEVSRRLGFERKGRPGLPFPKDTDGTGRFGVSPIR